MVYYQSRDGVSHSVAFTTDGVRDYTHNLTGLPVGGIHSISLVALIDLPSPVVGPVIPGEHIVYSSLVPRPLLFLTTGSGLGTRLSL